MKRIALCTPTLKEPHPAALASLNAAVPFLRERDYDVETICEVGAPYISWARSQLARAAFRPERNAEALVYLDDDVEYAPETLLRLLEADGDVVCGTYRFKLDEIKYMGALIIGSDGQPVRRADGAASATAMPAGFLKITRAGYERFARNFPQFIYGDMCVDLFNHGAHAGVWWGEDTAFSRNFRERCGDIWVIPDLDLVHHDRNGNAYPGNFGAYLAERPVLVPSTYT